MAKAAEFVNAVGPAAVAVVHGIVLRGQGYGLAGNPATPRGGACPGRPAFKTPRNRGPNTRNFDL